jgi:peroxiredoxin Q/BCP
LNTLLSLQLILDVSAVGAKVDIKSPFYRKTEWRYLDMSLEGKKAPDFNLEGSDGRQHSIRDYTGKTVVLFFYPKDNTSGCTKEACGFRDGYRHLLERNIVLLGVSKDSIVSHGKFITSYNLPFTLLSDPDTAMMSAYGAFGEKVMYGKKTTGTIRSTVVVGPDGIVRKHWTKVAKAEQHPAQVFDYLTTA